MKEIHTRGKGHMKTGQGGGHLKVEGGSSGGTELTDSLTLTLGPQRREKQCVALSQAVCGSVE